MEDADIVVGARSGGRAAAGRLSEDTGYRPVGIARIGSDGDAARDSRPRVRGGDGLCLTGASIMPRPIGGQSNAPGIMTGERRADFETAGFVQKRAGGSRHRPSRPQEEHG